MKPSDEFGPIQYVSNRVLTYSDPSGLQGKYGALVGKPPVVYTPNLPDKCGACGCTIFTEVTKGYTCKCSANGGFDLNLWAIYSATIYINANKPVRAWLFYEPHEWDHVV